ncbi:lymphotoxin-beta isoform X1 [Bufo gargarizans]|uniref:lymphotoxin-beta isoform X1 n=1 Tax=Bufo gargarizans TaxID=30331 RepID=UPI001CF4B971|nr:lymphotoxin-beta isoform X1 [Bufo gargarizans]
MFTSAAMRANWVPLLALLVAMVPLLVPGTETNRQTSLRPKLKAANEKSNWQKQNFRKPAAHLIGKSPSLNNTLKWRSEAEVAFTRKIKHPTSTTLVIPRQGLYYVYCQVGFEGSDNITLLSQVTTFHDSLNANVTLILGTESISGPPLPQKTWHASLTLGGLANLQKGQRLYVHVSHPELVDYTEGKTFFGIVMVS